MVTLMEAFALLSEALSRPKPEIAPLRLAKAIPDIKILQAHVLKAVQTFSYDDSDTKVSNVRAFYDGKESHEHEHRSSTTILDLNTRMENWCQSIFGSSSQFGLIINNLDYWNDDLCRYFAEIVALFPKHLRPPFADYGLSIIMGNYGFTPFGIHVDGDDKRLIHFHLGPGTKTMTTFLQSDYVRLTGAKRPRFDAGKLVSSGNSHTIFEGDIFFFPGEFYHIGSSDGFAAALVLTVTTVDMTLLAKRICIAQSEEQELIELLDSLSRIGESRLLSEYYHGPTLAEWLDRGLQEYLSKLNSKFGFLRPPFVRQDDFDLHAFYRIVKPFQIVKLRGKDSIRLFSRGSDITLLRNEGVDNLIDLINDGCKFNLALAMSFVNKAVSENDVASMLNIFYKTSSIERVTLT